MRISADDSSWKARGILRRDFRHSHGDPEVDTTKVKKRVKPRKRIAHKHDWVNDPGWPALFYYRWLKKPLDPHPQHRTRQICSVEGCDAARYIKNTRYRYEAWKWSKRQQR